MQRQLSTSTVLVLLATAALFGAFTLQAEPVDQAWIAPEVPVTEGAAAVAGETAPAAGAAIEAPSAGLNFTGTDNLLFTQELATGALSACCRQEFYDCRNVTCGGIAFVQSFFCTDTGPSTCVAECECTIK